MVSILVAVTVEPLFFLGMMYLLNIYMQNKFGIIIRKILGALYVSSFLIECFYYSVSGEWISLLAISNINQAYLLINAEYIGVIAIGLALVIGYLLIIDRQITRPKHIKIGMAFTMVSFFLLLLISTKLHSYVHINTKKITPVASLAHNACLLYGNNFSNATVDGYPYVKDFVYQDTIPFQKKGVTTPNVIIIFTEGTSARLVGAYNPKYHDVTPNIDEFAAASMRVDNYFNHTAATFRGTFGQLASSYNHRGGSGGWDTNKDTLIKRRFQSLPNILRDNYTTAFFSPHMESDPYTSLLHTLNFEYVYTRDEINQKFLGNNGKIVHNSLKDADMYKALISYMDERNDTAPFLISMYTFATHLGIELPDDATPYKINNESYESINSLHNLDDAFGRFWKWFIHSKYRDNTIIIFTADHAHYPDSDYMKLVKEDSNFTRCFIDSVPLIIYDPTHDLPAVWDANDRTSLDLTPTVCHLLGVNKKNSFLGKSLFEKKEENISVAAIGQEFFGIYNHTVHKEKDISSEYMDPFEQQRDEINRFYMYESANRVFH